MPNPKNFKAKVGKITPSDSSGVGRILLLDIELNGSYFRDHVWVRTNKQVDSLGFQEGDIMSGTAKVFEYPDIENQKQTKKGLRKLRNIKKLPINQHEDNEFKV